MSVPFQIHLFVSIELEVREKNTKVVVFAVIIFFKY